MQSFLEVSLRTDFPQAICSLGGPSKASPLLSRPLISLVTCICQLLLDWQLSWWLAVQMAHCNRLAGATHTQKHTHWRHKWFNGGGNATVWICVSSESLECSTDSCQKKKISQLINWLTSVRNTLDLYDRLQRRTTSSCNFSFYQFSVFTTWNLKWNDDHRKKCVQFLKMQPFNIQCYEQGFLQGWHELKYAAQRCESVQVCVWERAPPPPSCCLSWQMQKGLLPLQ